MELSRVFDFYKDNLHLMFTPNMFEKIADHSSNLQGHSFSNRGLILLQKMNADIVRTKHYWEVCGKDTSEMGFVYIVSEVPYANMGYMTDSGSIDSISKVIDEGLSQDELELALQLGIIGVENYKFVTSVMELYNIDSGQCRDLPSIVKDDIKELEDHRKLKIEILEEVFQKLGIRVDYGLDGNFQDYDEKDFNFREIDRLGENSFSFRNFRVKFIMNNLFLNLMICLYVLVKTSAAVINDMKPSDIDIEGKVINESMESLAIKYMAYAGITFFGFEMEGIKDCFIDADDLDAVYTTIKTNNRFVMDTFLDVIEKIFNRYIACVYKDDGMIFEHSFMMGNMMSFKNISTAFYDIFREKNKLNKGSDG